MTAERYVVLGLARPRAAWFSDVARWATAAALPLEFVKCLTPEEARARLAGGRRWSALLLDASTPGVDRDLIDAARAVGAAVLVVADERVDRSWVQLGASTVLPATLERDHLLAALVEHARPVARVTVRPAEHIEREPAPWRGRLVAFTGVGGAGASTLAALTAQGLGSDVCEQGLVLLADLALHADQGVIHHVGDIAPGLPELVDAHRLGKLPTDEIHLLAFTSPRHSYELLLGLRNHRDWAALRPRAVTAALDGLRRSYKVVVADIEADLEGERDTGSADVEERNALARSVVAEADVVAAVGTPSTVGVHRLARLVRELVRQGTAAERILTIVNLAPRSPRDRSELAKAIAALTHSVGTGLATPVFVPRIRRLDAVIRAAAAWPAKPCMRLRSAVEAIAARETPRDAAPSPGTFERVTPGSLGHFSDIEEDLA